MAEIGVKAQDTSSESSIDYEDIPVLGVGQKKPIKLSTYVELHEYTLELVRILEEVFELGIMKGTAKRYKLTDNDQPSDDEEPPNAQVCPMKFDSKPLPREFTSGTRLGT